MALLPTSGTISYNGFTFNSASKTVVAARPVYDRADRTIVAVVYSVTIVSYIPESSPGAGADTVIADLRQRLMSPGRDLTYTGQGFGDLTINSGNVKDVLWGPKPTQLLLEPIGSKALWKIIWSVDVAIPECSAAQYMNAVMAFNYETTYAIDGDGYTTRAIAGYLEIPMTRQGGGRNLPDSADEYRERINVPIPEGFKRTAQQFSVSMDKRRLEFTIVDEEQPSEALPAGSTAATGLHAVSSNQTGLRAWSGRISASYTVAKGFSRQLAYEAFFALITDRLETAKQNAERDSVIPYALEITQGLYQDGRRLTFSLSYTFTVELKKILAASGIWNPVPNTDSTQWAASVESVTGLRGFAGLRNRASDDIIVDLCGGASATVTGEKNTGNQGSFTGEREVEQDGFLDYQQEVDVVERPGWGCMKALPRQQTASMQTRNPLASMSGRGVYDPNTGGITGTNRSFSNLSFSNGSEAQRPPTLYYLTPFGGSFDGIVQGFQNIRLNLGQEGGLIRVTPGSSGGDVPQARVVSSFTIRLRGYAVSIGIPIQCPSLTKFEEADLIPEPTEKARFTTRVLGSLMGRPIIYAEWNIPYRAIYPNGARDAQ